MRRWKNSSEAVTGGDCVTETFVEDETNTVLGTVRTIVPPLDNGEWVTATFAKGADPATQNFKDLAEAKAAVEAAAG